MGKYCDYCGAWLDFYTRSDGVVVPIGCNCGSDTLHDTYAPRTFRPDQFGREPITWPITYPTFCWWCGEPVFYHTNGFGDCVLFDAPLGPPWYVHGCWAEHVAERGRAAAWSGLNAAALGLLPNFVTPQNAAEIAHHLRQGDVAWYNLHDVTASDLMTAAKRGPRHKRRVPSPSHKAPGPYLLIGTVRRVVSDSPPDCDYARKTNWVALELLDKTLVFIPRFATGKFTSGSTLVCEVIVAGQSRPEYFATKLYWPGATTRVTS